MEVAETTGKLHKNVIRDIKKIIEHLHSVDGSNLSRSIDSYFIADEYTNSQGYQQPMYRLTKKGCELFGTRMTGAKGTQFGKE